MLVTRIREEVLFVVKYDASKYVLAALLNQGGQPVDIDSRTSVNVKPVILQ